MIPSPVSTTQELPSAAVKEIPAIYTQQIERCLCHGHEPHPGPSRVRTPRPPMNNDKTHTILIAFLDINNQVQKEEQCGRDYASFPMNRLTVKVTGRPFIHAQIVMWVESRGQYVTYSVDHDRGVWVNEEKLFRFGWHWIKIMVTEAQELKMYNFLSKQAELKRPMNWIGQLLCLTYFPASGQMESWFCSELVAHTLVVGGVVKDQNFVPEALAPHALYDYLLLNSTYRPAPKLVLENNPVHALVFQKQVLALPSDSIALVRGQPVTSIAKAIQDSKATSSTSSTSSSATTVALQNTVTSPTTQQPRSVSTTRAPLSAFRVPQEPDK